MIIMTRKIGEKITIGDDISITIVDVADGQIHLGTDAPNEVAIHREEIYSQDKRESAQETIS